VVTAQTGYGERLLDVLARLEAHYDLDRWHWRPDTPPLDVCLGAILVQHTTWRSVEVALDRLRAAAAFDLESILSLPETELAELVRPAGLPLTKARRLHAFARLGTDAGGLDALLALDAAELRVRLLATPGIGPETADVILLFAAQALVFVHDAYAARLCRRLGLGPERDSYSAWQRWFEAGLPRDLRVYQRLRAGIVTHCKETCRSRPLCERCPLLSMCPYGQERLGPAA
jgi:endonuclease-3 related protein